MPVYNAEKFLHEAIASILSQTFQDFEFLIINDGSTDSSERIILSFSDARIRYVKHSVNAGLIATLNEGIGLATGKFFGRMDADDVSLDNRFQKQMEIFQLHPDAALVCSVVEQIDSKGNSRGFWKDDVDNIFPEQIRKTLAKANCIAHPSVMIRCELAKKYLYSSYQKASEDWDLWMRMVSDGKKIHKINIPLVKYRLHTGSSTIVFNRKYGPEKKVIVVKRKFLLNRIKRFRFGLFEWKVVYSLLRSFARNWKINLLPRYAREAKYILTISPVKAARQFSMLKQKIKTSVNRPAIFYFFPYTHVGGAEKIHAAITETTNDQDQCIFFTGFSANKKFLDRFVPNGEVLNIPHAANHPFFSKRTAVCIANFVNQSGAIQLFGCNSKLYYDLVPFLSSGIRCFDLKHDFGFEDTSKEKEWLPQFLFMKKRIYISQRALDEMKKFYDENFVDEEFNERLRLITNFTDVPLSFKEKNFDEVISVLYVGRGSAEKRVDMVCSIAKHFFETDKKIHFTIVGDVESSIDMHKYPFLSFTGEITNQNQLNAFYSAAHFLLITSDREGFPLVVMEAMAHGVVPVCTPAGDIPVYIRNDKTGFVTSSIERNVAMSEMIKIISDLVLDKDRFNIVSKNSYSTARENFSKEKFTSEYRKLFGLD